METPSETAGSALPPDVGLTDAQATRLMVLLGTAAAALLLVGGLAMALLA